MNEDHIAKQIYKGRVKGSRGEPRKSLFCYTEELLKDEKFKEQKTKYELIYK